jgi:Flp pilus assembly protein TadG
MALQGGHPRMMSRFGSRCGRRAGAHHRAGLGRLLADRSGATLIEFSLVGLPFLLLLLATFEIGFVYWGNKELENATNDAARLVRTGQVQAANMSQADLKAEACKRTAILIDCAARLRLDVRSAARFGDITPPEPTDGSGSLKSDADFTFAPGAADEAVLVSAFFDWPALFQSKRLLRASAPLRNEPF